MGYLKIPLFDQKSLIKIIYNQQEMINFLDKHQKNQSIDYQGLPTIAKALQ